MPEAALAAPPQPDSSAAALDPNAQAPSPGAAATSSVAPTEDWGRSWVRDGAFDHAAFERAPEDFKAYRKELETFKDPVSLAKSYHELRALASSKGAALLEPLPKDASPELRAERMNALRRAIGAPDKPEGYAVEWPKEIPEAMRDTAGVAAFAKIAHEEGISPAAFQKAVSFEIQRQAQAGAAQQKAVETMWREQDELARTAVAKEGLTYDKARELAERSGKRFFGMEKDNPFLQNATILLGLTRLGKAMGEDRLIQGDTGDQALRSHTPETAQKALEAIRDDKTNPKWFAYWNRDPENPKREKVHPDHDEVVAEARRLSALANANRRR